MAGADLTTLTGVEKETFEKYISEGVNNNFDLKDWFKPEETEYLGGEGTVWSIHTGRNVSPFWSNEGAAYPVAGFQSASKGRIKPSKIMARIQMTEEAMEDTVSSEAAFVNGVTDEKTRLIDDLSRRENHSLGMDGRAVLGLYASAASNVISMTLPGGITSTAANTFGNRFVDSGMFLAAINPSNGQLRTSVRQATAVSSAGTTVTLDSSTLTGWAANDYIVQAANASVTDVLDTSFDAAAWGLPGLIDDGTYRDNYYGILRSLVYALQSYVVPSFGAVSMDGAQRMSDVLYEKLGGTINGIAMHPSLRREWLKITDADRRYTGADLRDPDPSTKAFTQGDVTVDDVKIKALRSLGLDQVFFVDTKKAGMVRYVAEPGKFMDRDGSMWLRAGTGSTARHAYEATYFRRIANFIRNPGVCGRWDGCTGSTLIIVRDL